MSNQVTFKPDPKNTQIVCGQCRKDAVIHAIHQPGAYSTLLHISCHGQHRLVRVDDFAVQRVQRQARPGDTVKYTTTWEQIQDSVADTELKGWRADLEEHLRQYHAILESLKTVIACRAGELSR